MSTDTTTAHSEYPGRPAHMILSDGRRMTWREYGDESGFPIFYFHGTPGSSLEGAVFDKAARRHGARLIAVDRPGFGESTFKHNRKVTDWPDDVKQVADHLNLGVFSVFGWSGGGPHALVCAVSLSQRLLGVGLIAPQTAKVVFNRRLETFGAHVWMPLVRALCRIPHLGEGVVGGTLALSDRRKSRHGDKNIYNAILARSQTYAQSQSSDGAIADNTAILGNWGISEDEIASELRALTPPLPITIWQGAKDSAVSVEGSKALARLLPDCTLIYDPFASHLEIFLDQTDSVIATLMRPRPPTHPTAVPPSATAASAGGSTDQVGAGSH